MFNNIVFWFSSTQLTEKKKTTKTVAKKTTKKATKSTKKVSKKGKKKKIPEPEDTGIIIVDDDLTIDRETELEERRAYLEEARSQEASSD